MRHQDLTLNHRLESWVFANAAARLAAGSYVSGDVGRIGYQSDNGTYWRLLSSTPTWALLQAASATLQTASASPTGSSTAIGVMMGLSALITPLISGNVFVTIAGSITSSSTALAQTQIRYGTGTAPVNGAALTGTAIGNIASRSNVGAALLVPFSCSALISGLTPNTQIWLDLVVSAAGGVGISTVQALTVSAFEV